METVRSILNGPPGSKQTQMGTGLVLDLITLWDRRKFIRKPYKNKIKPENTWDSYRNTKRNTKENLRTHKNVMGEPYGNHGKTIGESTETLLGHNPS